MAVQFGNDLKPQPTELEYNGLKGDDAVKQAWEDWDGYATMLENMDKQGYGENDPKRLQILERFQKAYDIVKPKWLK